MIYNKAPCRCKKCGTRKTLKRHPDNYLRVPACSCGHRQWYVDEWGIKGCTCYSYSFMHRRGSGYCVHGKLFDPSDDEQYNDRK